MGDGAFREGGVRKRLGRGRRNIPFEREARNGRGEEMEGIERLNGSPSASEPAKAN